RRALGPGRRRGARRRLRRPGRRLDLDPPRDRRGEDRGVSPKHPDPRSDLAPAATPAEPAGLARAASRPEVVGPALHPLLGAGAAGGGGGVLGPGSLWAVLLAGVAVLLLVLCFAEAASYFDEPGGAYLYARVAFGRFVGFEVGWMTWLARVTAVASLSAGFAQ